VFGIWWSKVSPKIDAIRKGSSRRKLIKPWVESDGFVVDNCEAVEQRRSTPRKVKGCRKLIKEGWMQFDGRSHPQFQSTVMVLWWVAMKLTVVCLDRIWQHLSKE
jgi:hypothetical protein